jgi:hypothetical protein
MACCRVNFTFTFTRLHTDGRRHDMTRYLFHFVNISQVGTVIENFVTMISEIFTVVWLKIPSHKQQFLPHVLAPLFPYVALRYVTLLGLCEFCKPHKALHVTADVNLTRHYTLLQMWTSQGITRHCIYKPQGITRYCRCEPHKALHVTAYINLTRHYTLLQM